MRHQRSSARQGCQACSLNWTGEHGNAACAGGEFVQICILATASNDVDGSVGASGKRCHFCNGFRIAGGKAYIYAAHKLTDGLGHVLPGFKAGATNLVDHGIRRQEAVVVHVHVGFEAVCLFCVGNEVGEAPLDCLMREGGQLVFVGLLMGVFSLYVGNAVQLAANRLDHPQAHDVLQEAEAQLKAAFIGEVLETGGI